MSTIFFSWLHIKHLWILLCLLDSLVLHLQLLHDGHFPGWPGLHDFDENSEEGLCSIQQRGGNG